MRWLPLAIHAGKALQEPPQQVTQRMQGSLAERLSLSEATPSDGSMSKVGSGDNLVENANFAAKTD